MNNELSIIKRNGDIVPFDTSKITSAISKAMQRNLGYVEEDVAEELAAGIKEHFMDMEVNITPTIEDVEVQVVHGLIEAGYESVAKSYESYRKLREYKRNTNTSDDSILKLMSFNNVEVMEENSNKNPLLLSTQRDLIAGEVSKDIARRHTLPTNIVQAHDEGAIHFHDMDYYSQNMFNCCLINLGDMLDNGTVINKRMVDTPKSFQVACTVTTQIIAQVASSQFGGQSIDIKHLAKYLRLSKERYYDLFAGGNLELWYHYRSDMEDKINKLVQKELESGIQTLQYQINTLMTTNGQSPFITIFMNLEEGYTYEDELALIIEEILKQRIVGIKNEVGVYTTPAFPKLIYVLHDHNCLKSEVEGKYDYLTKLAVECSSKRLYPDYISAKHMKKNYEGNVFSPMGCRSFLTPWKDEYGNYQFEGRFNIGVVSLNLPQVALLAKGDKEKFWKILDSRLELCYEALICRVNKLKGTLSDESPMHWQYGAIARLESGEVIDKYLEDSYSTLALGYVGVYEAVKVMTGESHTSARPNLTSGKRFAEDIIKRLADTVEQWKLDTGYGFSLYGTPAESLSYRFAKVDLERFGSIADVTDKGYYTNSYHVDVREEISVFDKLKFESYFQNVSTGGCISMVEIPNMTHNLEALEQVVNYIYHNIQYAEFNTKSDHCHECNFAGEMVIKDNLEWTCPNCGNTDKSKMNVIRRTCGYLGDNYWNKGKTKEIKDRVLHL